MKIIVNRSSCVGHARCAAVAPEIFPLDDDGYIATDSFTVLEGQEQLAQRGARACPERALSVADPKKTDG
ncbi:ferredoxin [Spongiibacter sp. KMU-166]|uniref:Ferredoxin n=1 Tax=Spongiibacter thalassae TaxID=2721624 RepID=A0ABX1GD40_9GAMM|nr:ferredoxin [Spongiibacter thalassae]